MDENKPATATFSAEALGDTDFERLDAQVVQPKEYDDIPELTDEWFAQADLHRGGILIRRGRPKAEQPKKQVTIRLDADVLDGFRSTGPGWQTKINEALRDWLGKR